MDTQRSIETAILRQMLNEQMDFKMQHAGISASSILHDREASAFHKLVGLHDTIWSHLRASDSNVKDLFSMILLLAETDLTSEEVEYNIGKLCGMGVNNVNSVAGAYLILDYVGHELGMANAARSLAKARRFLNPEQYTVTLPPAAKSCLSFFSPNIRNSVTKLVNRKGKSKLDEVLLMSDSDFTGWRESGCNKILENSSLDELKQIFSSPAVSVKKKTAMVRKFMPSTNGNTINIRSYELPEQAILELLWDCGALNSKKSVALADTAVKVLDHRLQYYADPKEYMRQHNQWGFKNTTAFPPPVPIKSQVLRDFFISKDKFLEAICYAVEYASTEKKTRNGAADLANMLESFARVHDECKVKTRKWLSLEDAENFSNVLVDVFEYRPWNKNNHNGKVKPEKLDFVARYLPEDDAKRLILMFG
jgi:hypothetical protein